MVATVAPGANDDVILDGTAPQYNLSIVNGDFGGTIKSLEISGENVELQLSKSLMVTTGLTQSKGTIYAQGLQMTLGGTSNWTGGGMSNPALIINSGATLNKHAAAGMNGGSITNNGILNLKQNSSVVSVTNHGTLNLDPGGGSSATMSITNHGTINQPAGINILNSLDNKGAIVINGGELTLGGSFARQTGAGATITFNGGSLKANVSPFELQAGSIFGSASGSTIIGNVNNSGGTIYAGGTTGTLTITHNYTQGAQGKLVVGVDVTGGTTSKLKVTGTATLGGTLTVNWSGTPAAGSEWEVALFQGGVMMMSDFTIRTSIGSANPTFTHMAGTWNPYKIKVA